MARVRLHDVGKTFPNGTVALAGLDLQVEDGEIVVLVGPSGCGKSTILRLVAGLDRPTTGTVEIDGRNVSDLEPQARNVAMVFQDYALYPHRTVRGNLAFPLEMRRLGKAEIAARITRTSEMLGLDPLLDRLPRELSGGQRQRVAMGRALVRDPAVWLLDEPLSNLDATLRAQVRADIETLQRRTHTTMLYVTHDQVEAMTLADRLAVLDRGRLRQVGTPRDVYDRPADSFVAGFLGSPPMNLLAAVASVRDGDCVMSIDRRTVGAIPAPPGAPFPRDVVLGVRPEAVRVATETGAAPHGRVTLVELLGHEALVHVQLSSGTVIARLPVHDAPRRDDAVHVSFDPAFLYVFAPGGELLSAPSTSTTR